MTQGRGQANCLWQEDLLSCLQLFENPDRSTTLPHPTHGDLSSGGGLWGAPLGILPRLHSEEAGCGEVGVLVLLLSWRSGLVCREQGDLCPVWKQPE